MFSSLIVHLMESNKPQIKKKQKKPKHEPFDDITLLSYPIYGFQACKLKRILIECGYFNRHSEKKMQCFSSK